MVDNKGYWFEGNFYVERRVLCGICSLDMGESQDKKGDLSYCGCEEYRT